MKHVTILGRGEVFSPIPPGEAWGVNFLPRSEEEWDRVTRQFQLHPYAMLTKGEKTALAALRVPTYVRRVLTGAPHAIAYPLHAVPPGPFASSFDYMMALALWEGFTSILLTGIAYQSGTLRERLCEHVSLAYWIGLARGRRLTVEVSPQSTLLKFPWRYGFDYQRERRWAQQQGKSALACPHWDDGQAARRRVAGIVASGKRAPK